MKADLKYFTEMKSKHKLLVIIGGIVLLYSLGKVMHSAAKRRAFKKAYSNENYSTAKSLFTALYPEGKADAKFSIWNPMSALNVVTDVFKADADINTLMRIAGNELNADNFKKVASGYSKMYDSSLLRDLQNRMDEDFERFDNKVRKQSAIDNDPTRRNLVIKTLSEKMYEDLDEWFSFGVDDNLYNQFNQMSDADFIAVYDDFNDLLDSKNEKGTLRSWIGDDKRTMKAFDDIEQRFNDLGLA